MALTLTDIKRLIKKYDDLMGIDPKGKSKEQLIKEIEKNGYTVDHENKTLIHKGKNKMKRKPEKVKMPPKEKKKPVDKSAARANRKEKIIKEFLKDPELHKEIMQDERIKKQKY